MKIAFIDRLPVGYGIGALEGAPLGGSQSALLVVAEALAALGEEVMVAGMQMAHGERRHGVLGLNLPRAIKEGLPEADVAVSVNLPLPEGAVARFPRRPRLAHWHKNDVRSPDSVVLSPALRRDVDRFVFCSHAQASGFIARHGLPGGRVSVIENPLAPVFCDLFRAGEPILAAKDAALLVYASAPNRGLEGLIDIVFPELRKRRPKLRLEVYSGFQQAQGMQLAHRETGKLRDYEALLAKWASSPGVVLRRGVPKPALAARLKQAAMLCYPCTFRETSCHVALEAMAAACLVSTSDAGALAETTAGFARLTPFREPEGLNAGAFVSNTLRLLDEAAREPAATEARLRRQVAHVNAQHAPAAIARRWRALLQAELQQPPAAR